MPVKEINEKNFDEFVIKNDKPVLVDFWAGWCGPCRMVSPIVDKLATVYEGKLAVGKINVDEQPQLARRYQVMSIPSIFIFKDGEIVQQIVGARDYDEFADLIDKVL